MVRGEKEGPVYTSFISMEVLNMHHKSKAYEGEVYDRRSLREVTRLVRE